jgi:hypothetical protein
LEPFIETPAGAYRGGKRSWLGVLGDALAASTPGLGRDAARQRAMRCRGRRIDAFLADTFAVALGLHPIEVWPGWAHVDQADEQLDDLAA